ncbi:MAG: FAD:protein FMN transferase [Alphaproteobacteria bacterium]|nr:FAD:protein FMN transferase [Alphaproteobacteria bacterium]
MIDIKHSPPHARRRDPCAGPISRRRAITIAGCAAAASLAGFGTWPTQAASLVRWRGVVIGADATLVIAHHSTERARALIARCLDEIRRLESLFSLYAPDSTLVRLNRDGRVGRPPLDFYRLLADCRRFHRATGGAFDPSIQPVWRLYADHFASADDAEGPAAGEVAAARARVGFTAVDITPDVVAFRRPSMALTLNGIAQGYITDRVTDMLRDSGVSDTLVSLGETRGLGRHPDGRSWRVGLSTGRDNDPSPPTIELSDGAVATSAGSGTLFEPSGRFHHLLDPETGAASHACRSVSVVAARATTADAVSTALAVLPPERAESVLHTAGAVRAFITLQTGIRREVAAAPA